MNIVCDIGVTEKHQSVIVGFNYNGGIDIRYFNFGYKLTLVDYVKLANVHEEIEIVYLPHDSVARSKTDFSNIYTTLVNLGFTCKVLPRMAFVDGVNLVRRLFIEKQIKVKSDCKLCLELLKDWRYTKSSANEFADVSSDVGACFRYLSQIVFMPEIKTVEIKENPKYIEGVCIPLYSKYVADEEEELWQDRIN